jgi:hypothetical protein
LFNYGPSGTAMHVTDFDTSHLTKDSFGLQPTDCSWHYHPYVCRINPAGQATRGRSDIAAQRRLETWLARTRTRSPRQRGAIPTPVGSTASSSTDPLPTMPDPSGLPSWDSWSA